MKKYFVEAARCIAEEKAKYSCIALAAVSDPTYKGHGCELNPYVKKYEALMSDGHSYLQWEINYSGTDSRFRVDDEECRHLRVMLLLMAGEVLGSEDE